MITMMIKSTRILLGGGKRNAVSMRLLPLSNHKMCA